MDYTERYGEISDKLGIELFDVRSDRSWEKVLASIDDLNNAPVQVHGNRVIPSKGVFSNKEIKVAVELNHIIHYPNEPELITGSSIDMRLGRFFYRTDQLRDSRPGIYNFHDQDDVDEYFGEVIEAQPLRENSYMMRKFGHTMLRNIDPDSLGIHMKPGERLLGHSLGVVGILAPGASSFSGNSTSGRNGFTVCKDADIGNPNYAGRVTLELENTNPEHIWLGVGQVVAQARFYGTGPVEDNQHSYQTASDPKQYLANWHHSDMKPKVKHFKPVYGEALWERGE